MDPKKIRGIEQLIQDPSFRAWCLSDGTIEPSPSPNRWISQTNLSKQEVWIAKQIVLDLEFYHNSLSPNKKYRAWEKLAEQIHGEYKNQPVSSFDLPPKKQSLSWKYTAAAVLILTIVSFLTVKFASLNSSSQNSEIIQPPPELVVSTNYGEQKVIQLDSGTRITLNANSSLTYWKGWVFKDEVKVKLKGEAYFDVAKRKVNPVFKVVTNDGVVSVLGTQFMVSAWDEKTSVILKEGSVSVDNSPEAGGTDQQIILNSNEMAEFGKGFGDIVINQVNARLYTSWTRGFFAFDHTPLLDVVKRIEHTFGVDIVIADPSLLTRKVSGSVESKNARMVVRGLAKTLQISADFTEDKIVLSDSILTPFLIN